MFSFKNLFNAKKKESNIQYTIENISDTELKIRFKPAFIRDYSFYEQDIFDERGVLIKENNSVINKDSEKEFSIYQWIKKDGDFVEQGEIISLIRYVPYTNCHGYLRVAVLPPLISPENGYLDIIKQKDEEVVDGMEICKITCTEKPTDLYPLDETVSHYFFNKYDIPVHIREPKNIRGEFDQLLWHFELDKIHLLDWLVDDKAFVNTGDPIAQVGAIYEGKPIYKFTLKSKVSGFIYKYTPDYYSEPIYQDNLLCCFFKTSKDLHDYIYFNHPDIIYDDFKKNKTIKWSIISGHVLPFGSTDEESNIGAIIMNSHNEEFNLMFSLENHDSKDYIVFKFFTNQYKLNPKDEVQFMYEDESINKFQIIENSKKASSSWNRLYETKVPITQKELSNLKEKEFIKWKIEFNNGADFILGCNSNERVNGKLLSKIINDFVSVYENLVSTEIPDHKPLYERDVTENSAQTSDLCHVYLMYDTTNNYHKIGISNNPKYREKTLQAEKPTIVLICAKKFPSRKMAESFEKSLHMTFAKKRIRGEWFELNDLEANEIMLTLK